MEEERLIYASQQGEVEAFNLLVQRYQGLVFNVALRMLGNAAAAEDATQEAFISAFRSIKRFHQGNFRAWLLRIASNACRDHLRSAQVQRDTSLDALAEASGFDPPSDAEAPEQYALRQELSRTIREGLVSLPQDQRLALVLVDIHGLSYEEAAQSMNVPIGTVRSRLSRGRAALRDYLQAQRELLPHPFRLKSEG